MRNIAFWKFLILALITICLFGCDQARNMSDEIIGEGVPTTTVEEPIVEPSVEEPIVEPSVEKEPSVVEPSIEEPPIVEPPVIVEVIVGGNHGIHVRDSAGLHLGEDNIIGHMHGGMRGEVIEGPKEVSGLTWWKIKWFDGSCEISKDVPCIGWSAEFHTDNTRLLKFIN